MVGRRARPSIHHSPFTIYQHVSSRAAQLKRREGRRRGGRLPSLPVFNCGPRYFVAGALTLTSISVFFVPPPNKPPRYARNAATTTIRKITTMATTPVLLEPSPSAIFSESSSKFVLVNCARQGSW